MHNFTIVIPTINRADLLKESIESLNSTLLPYAKELIIIDNGQQDLSFLPNAGNLTVIKEEKNLGVAASWNKGLAQSFKNPAVASVVVLNDDIVWGIDHNSLQDLLFFHKEASFVTGPFFWSVFIVNRKAVETIGYFDEAFYPAYFEDNDYDYRLKLAGIPSQFDRRLQPKIARNSQTIKKDSSLNSLFEENKKYYKTKWGGGPGNEVYRVPFNN